jgi:DNA-binding NarL/FixJ family response regulator
MSQRLRVVIAEDHHLVREGATRLLEDSGAIEVVAAVGTPTELELAVERHQPDVVILDLAMPLMDGLEIRLAAL